MARLRVHLTPRAKREGIAGWRDGVLRVRVMAPPVDGRANEALLRLLAEALGLPRGDVTLAAGATSRDKTIEVAGMDDAALRARLS
ncbi:MAG: DUF167 domain-containing protein [Dehalococcoidia bacterium]|nr:DUF167 domain-containing protein [Dehalococcoidia bacterium]